VAPGARGPALLPGRAAGREQGAVRGQGEFYHFAGVAFDLAPQPARRGVPEADGLVRAPREKALAVGGERQGPDPLPAGVPLAQAAARGRVVHAHPAAEVVPGQEFAVRGEAEGHDLAPAELAEERSGADVPDAEAARVAPVLGRREPDVRGEGDRATKLA